MNSARETALRALHQVLRTALPEVQVLRNEPEVQSIPAGGLVVLRDGDPGEPEALLSPMVFIFSHTAEVVVQVQHRMAAARDAALDQLLVALCDAVAADGCLGGAVDRASCEAPEILDEPVEGGETIKAALVPVTLEYVTARAVG